MRLKRRVVYYSNVAYVALKPLNYAANLIKKVTLLLLYSYIREFYKLWSQTFNYIVCPDYLLLSTMPQ